MPIYRKKLFYARTRFFRQCEKGIIHKTTMETFFCRIYRLHGAFKMSYDHSSIYYNLQETYNMWPLSSIRGFACHSCLDNFLSSLKLCTFT